VDRLFITNFLKDKSFEKAKTTNDKCLALRTEKGLRTGV